MAKSLFFIYPADNTGFAEGPFFYKMAAHTLIAKRFPGAKLISENDELIICAS